MKLSVFFRLLPLLSLCSYAQSLASTRVLKHSEQSSRGSCGENLAWASYDQSGAGFIVVSRPVIYCTAGMMLWGHEDQLGSISPGPPPPPDFHCTSERDDVTHCRNMSDLPDASTVTTDQWL